MHKKAIIIIAASVGLLVIVSGVVGAIVAFNRNNNRTVEPASTLSADPSKQEAQTEPDLSVDLGACTAVSHAKISEAVSLAISEVRDAENRGFGHELNGDKSQSCVYAFSAENNLNNRLTITVTKFSNDVNKNDAIAGLKDETTVSGIDDSAYSMTSKDAEINQNTYSLFVIRGMYLYTLIILQPADADHYTAASAETALESIAKAIE